MTQRNNLYFVILSVLVLASAFGIFLSHKYYLGLTGRYYVGEEKVLIHTKHDSQVSFENDIAIRSILTNHWDFKALGFPENFPSFNVQWDGYIDLSRLDDDKDVGVENHSGLFRRAYKGDLFIKEPISEVIVDTISFGDNPGSEKPDFPPFAIEWYGHLNISNSGQYQFATESDDGSWVYIDEQLIIDNGGKHPLRRREGSVYLDRGKHLIRVRFTDFGGDALFKLTWTPPNAEEQAIPASVLSLPNGKDISLAIETNVSSDIFVDGKNICSTVSLASTSMFCKLFTPEIHPIRIRLSLPPLVKDNFIFWTDYRYFKIFYSDRQGQFRKLPDTVFLIDPLPSFLRQHLLVKVLIVGVLINLLMITFLAHMAHESIASFLKKYFNWLFRYRNTCLLTIISLLSLFLRFYQYDTAPFFCETIDEFCETWVGWNLINKEQPTGCYWPGVYKQTLLGRWFSMNWLIAEFNFHPPPLFPFLVGIVTTLAGAQTMFEVTLSSARILPVVSSVVTTVLVFFVGRRLYSERVALVASFLYASIPIIVVSGRLAKSESVMIPLSLACILFALRYLQHLRISDLVISAIASGLCVLSKQNGVYAGAVVTLMLIRARHIRALFTFLGISTSLASLYFVYGWWYNWDEFIRLYTFLSQSQGTRMTSFLEFFTKGAVVTTEFGTGWIIWLWITAVFASIHYRKEQTLLYMILIYVLLMAITVFEHYNYGWYRTPLYPLLCITGGVFVVDWYKRPDFIRTIVFTLIAVIPALHYLLPPGEPSSPRTLQLLVILLVLPSLTYTIAKTNWSRVIAKIGVIVLLGMFSVINLMIISNFTAIYFALSSFN